MIGDSIDKYIFQSNTIKAEVVLSVCTNKESLEHFKTNQTQNKTKNKASVEQIKLR